MCTSIGLWAETLPDVVCNEEAADYIRVVDHNLASKIDLDYKHGLQVDKLSRQQVAEVGLN